MASAAARAAVSVQLANKKKEEKKNAKKKIESTLSPQKRETLNDIMRKDKELCHLVHLAEGKMSNGDQVPFFITLELNLSLPTFFLFFHIFLLSDG